MPGNGGWRWALSRKASSRVNALNVFPSLRRNKRVIRSELFLLANNRKLAM